jgi:hypothetical protein
MLSKQNPLKLGRFAIQAMLLLLAAGLLMGVGAQSTTVGNISGTVRDQSGAVVPNAEVVIKEENTGFTRTVNTGSDGVYSAQSLPVGRYTITTSPQGFKTTVASGVELNVSANLVVNLTVEVGAVNETVTVTGEAVVVETRSGNVSSLIGEKQVTELPLNGRNYAQLALIVPGFRPSTARARAARLPAEALGSTRASICLSTETGRTTTCGQLTASTTWTWARTARCWSSPR